jgi:hypothetical protein
MNIKTQTSIFNQLNKVKQRCQVRWVEFNNIQCRLELIWMHKMEGHMSKYLHKKNQRNSLCCCWEFKSVLFLNSYSQKNLNILRISHVLRKKLIRDTIPANFHAENALKDRTDFALIFTSWFPGVGLHFGRKPKKTVSSIFFLLSFT